MSKVEQTIEINAPIQKCFDEWMKFESFPRFMSHVRSVTQQNERMWHWTVDGPLGSSVEWDAIMTGKFEDKMISWHSVQDSDIEIQGSVLFSEVSPGLTKITSKMSYEPPLGGLGETVARIFSNPDAMVKQDLKHFKELMEAHKAKSI